MKVEKYNKELLPDYYYYRPTLVRKAYPNGNYDITVYLKYASAGRGMHPKGYKYDGKFIISYIDDNDTETVMVTTTPYEAPIEHIYAELPAYGDVYGPHNVVGTNEYDKANEVFDKLVKKLESGKLNEGGLSRIWQHTKDDSTFAIIGSQDKDTKEDRRDELIDEVSKLSHRRDNKIGYKPLWGRYEYEDGTIGEEMSLIIFNIDKRDALRIAKKLNQESIIWKDVDFFGFLTTDGKEDGEFSRNRDNMNFTDDDIKLFGSRLARHKNKNQQKWFKFVMEEYEPNGERNSIRNMATRKPRQRKELFSIDKL